MLNSIWIELHQEMPRHPKTLAFAQALKVSRREAVGLLVDLWTWGLSCADEDGSLKSIGNEGIALALDWPVKRAPSLVRALVECGWLDALDDGQYRLHDWPDYTSKLSEKRKDAERKRRERRRGQSGEKPSNHPDASDPCPQYVHGQSADCPTLTTRAGITPPHQTEPNQNKPSVINTPSASTVEDAASADGGVGPDFGLVCQAFEAQVNSMPSHKDESVLQELFGKYPVDRILSAIDETARCKGRSASYVRSVLVNEDQEQQKARPPTQGPDLTDPSRYKNFGK